MENNLAIIPARGGSKRIPKKNIKSFLGKPIISYSIELAKSSGLFNEVMVSTDDQEIANLSKSYGAKIPFIRSSRAADDYATLNDVLLETISEYKNEGKKFDFICIILPTAPLIQKSIFFESFEMIKKNNWDSVRPMVKFSYPIQRAYRLSKNKLEMLHPDYYNTRSQDLEPAYHDAGQFYWVNKNKSLIDKNKGGIQISDLEAQDIDNESDWTIAEMKYKLLNNL